MKIKTSFQQLFEFFQDIPELEQHIIPLGHKIKLFVVNINAGDGFISCINAKIIKDFIEMHKDFNDFGNNYRGETGLPMKEFGLCLAKVHEQWYRAITSKSKGDGRPMMVLIDLNSKQRVRVKDIIPLPMTFVDYPLMSEVCRVLNFESIKKTSPGLIEESKVITVDEVTWNKKDKTLELRFDFSDSDQ